jgi:hypothetical protein
VGGVKSFSFPKNLFYNPTMSSVSHALPGKPTFGSLLTRIFIIALIWAGLVTGLLHYLGHVWPVAYQVSQAEAAEAERNEHAALNLPPAAAQAVPAADTTPAPAAVPAPAAGSMVALAATTAQVTTVPAQLAVAAPAAGAATAPDTAAPANSTAAVSSAPASSAASAAASASAVPAASAPAISTAAPAASAPAASAPAAGSAANAAPAASAGSAPSPAPAPKAATGEKVYPYDSRLAGFNRTALTNVAIFYSIVVSILSGGAIILQLFKYSHRPEEEAAH